MKHPSGSVGLLKEATDDREANAFIRGSTILNDALVTVIGESTSLSGTSYFLVSLRAGVSGFVKAGYIVQEQEE